jgi:pimeloyl-ACP methyl ester carboxylesterase
VKSSPRILIALTLGLLISLSLIQRSPAAKAAPLDLSGEIDGAPYRIRVPEVWNGTLLIFAHGYRDKADHPGEVDNRNADVAPSAALEAPLLAQGFALAGTAYKDNGWAIEEAIQDVKNLAVFFRDNVAQPQRTIIVAASMGTFVGFKSMEQFGGIYDGALCLCAAGAGATRLWDSGVPLYLAYDIIFGIPASWGTVGEVRNDIDFDTEVLAKLGPELSNIANFPQFEFIRLVAKNPGRGLTPPAPPAFYPGWALTDFFFFTEARAELQRRAGGPFVQNLDQNYDLLPAEKVYLASIGLPTPVVDGWLAQMNARRNIAADPAARNYVRNNTDFNGKIHHPILTVHTIIDPLLVVANDSAYAQLNASRRREDLLFQTYTTGVGHCNLTGPQILTAIGAIDSWVRTGVRPTNASFPAALGFDQTFVPPPY